MELIKGRKEEIDRRQERRKESLRRIMLHSKDHQKAIHAAVRWYGMRQKWETDSQKEFFILEAVLTLMAKNTPEWIAREFPPMKQYDGERWGTKDYYSSVEALADTKPFGGDEVALMAFLMEWGNVDIIRFCVAQMTIIDELRALDGQEPVLVEFMESQGVPSYKMHGGALFDRGGRFIGKEKRRRLRLVK